MTDFHLTTEACTSISAIHWLAFPILIMARDSNIGPLPIADLLIGVTL